MGVVLYMFPVSPPCRAVLMTARHIGVNVEIKEENSFWKKGEPSFLKINKRGCVPTIDDDGFYLWESRAIMTYLVNKYAPCNPVYPREPEKRALVDMMLSFDQGTLYKAQVDYLYPQVYHGHSPRKEAADHYRNAVTILEDTLAGSAYVAGDHLTLADLSVAANISLAEAYDYDFRPFPNVRLWLNTLKERLPYYKEVNDIPLLQFKFCFRRNLGYEEDDANASMTKL